MPWGYGNFGRYHDHESLCTHTDEATSNVDNATDALIQRIIRTTFAHCTVLTIAHRLHTIMDCDRVMVLSGGTLAEFDRPAALVKVRENQKEKRSHTRGISSTRTEGGWLVCRHGAGDAASSEQERRATHTVGGSIGRRTAAYHIDKAHIHNFICNNIEFVMTTPPRCIAGWLQAA